MTYDMVIAQDAIRDAGKIYQQIAMNYSGTKEQISSLRLCLNTLNSLNPDVVQGEESLKVSAEQLRVNIDALIKG